MLDSILALERSGFSAVRPTVLVLMSLHLNPVRSQSLHKPALSFPGHADSLCKIDPTDMVFLPVVR